MIFHFVLTRIIGRETLWTKNQGTEVLADFNLKIVGSSDVTT